VLNPLILGSFAPEGPGAKVDIVGDVLPIAQVAAVTALVAGVMTLLFGLVANYPFAIATEPGINTLVAVTFAPRGRRRWAAALVAAGVELADVCDRPHHGRTPHCLDLGPGPQPGGVGPDAAAPASRACRRLLQVRGELLRRAGQVERLHLDVRGEPRRQLRGGRARHEGPHARPARLHRAERDAFVAGVRAGEFDRP
jgi:hypothetical protein